MKNFTKTHQLKFLGKIIAISNKPGYKFVGKDHQPVGL
jgi:hypothetical protein